MTDIINDLEEDYDPYYSQHGIPGSNADTCLYDDDEIGEVCKNCGLVSFPVHMQDRFERMMMPWGEYP